MSWISLFRRFFHDRRANVAINFALLTPVIFVAVGAAVDYSLGSSQKTGLQNAADAGALAGAKELNLGGVNQAYAAEIAKIVAQNNLNGENVVVAAAMTPDKAGMEVTITQKADSFFSKVMSRDPADISVRAVATSASAAQKVCVVGLDEVDTGVVNLNSAARLTAPECAVFSNSKSSSGLRAEDNSLLKAQLICSAGGKTGSASNYAPAPMTDCPVIKDPLASRPAPAVGPCNFVNLIIKDVVRVLSPGTYCGGLRIRGSARVQVQPGVYVMRNGPLLVEDNAQLEGDYVGFYFTGLDATMKFTKNAKVTLGAPKSGTMAGILFFEDRNNAVDGKFQISSDFTRKLLGTIYLSKGRLRVDGTQPVADQSAYTAIVTRRVELTQSPNLVINSSYDATDVPVPNGIGPATGKTRLTQ
jgi:Flp pilus assembly protein TadG